MPVDETRGPLSRTRRGGSAATVEAAERPPSGLVLVDKPAGPSSFEVVGSIARGLRTAGMKRRVKAGHAGTLDPAATGLLLVLVGRATRLAQYMVGLDKRYRTDIRLGMTTTTGDAEGEDLEQAPPRSTSGLADELVGELDLRVPAASAIKIDGERAYARYRRGEDVEMPIRRSTILAVDVVERADDLLTLDLTVSTGTYIRAIAHHLGGHCLSIRRLAVGPFEVDNADPRAVMAPVDALPFLPRFDIDDASAAALRNGRPVACEGSGTARAVNLDELVAVVARDGSVARPETVLAR